MTTLKALTGFFVIAISLAASQAFATPQQLLTNVHSLRLLSTESLTNFYMYSGLDADAKYGRKILKNLEGFNTVLDQTRQLPAADNIKDSMAEIDKEWKEFNRLIRINYNDMEKQGFPNIRLVDEMGKTNASLLKLLTQAYIDAQISTGFKPAEVVETARLLAITMEEITAQYSARGTSNLGQVFMGSYERTLEQMAEAFRQSLIKLKQQADPQKSARLLRSIDSKWNFMERSIKNYNDNTVPFLVTSYSERIIENLAELIALHEF